jgi:protein-disulfide isomerase
MLSLLALVGGWFFAAPAVLAQTAPAAADPRLQDMSIGRTDAPITIVEYASLTCPHCAHFHADIMSVLKKDYIDTGKVRLIFRDFPLDQLALAAEQMTRCAGPERFFSFLEVLYAQQRNWAGAPDPMAALTQIGRLGGLTSEQITACFADQAVSDYILNSRLEGNQKFGVNSTPTLIINGKVEAGVPELAEFRKKLDGLLSSGSTAPGALPGAAATSGTSSMTSFLGGNMKLYLGIGVVVLIVGGIVVFLLRTR